MSLRNADRGPNRYAELAILNCGSTGFVQLARDKITNEQVAIKYIERGEKISRHVLREIINHRNLLHHHVVQFKEVFLTPQHLCIVMEYVPGGDVMQYIRRRNGLTEDEARWFFQQLILGLDYCHRMGVVNRDIKLENTLLDNSPWPVLKICDFGFSKHERLQSAPDSRVGTPAYLAPEVVNHTRGSTYDGKLADIWSCGVFLYVLLVGSYPFDRPEDKQQRTEGMIMRILERIMNVDYTIPSYISISDAGRDLIQRIFVKDTDRRITMGEIMEHPWFNVRLPTGAKEMNTTLYQQISGLQSVAEIERIVEQAKVKELVDEDIAIDEEFDKLSNESFGPP